MLIRWWAVILFGAAACQHLPAQTARANPPHVFLLDARKPQTESIFSIRK